MSILTPSRSTRANTDVRPAMIEWTQPGENLWVGKIHLDYAGMVELVDDRYLATDWKNERLASYATLDEAQHSLEPAARVDAFESAQRRAERTQWIASTTATLAIVAAATLGGWLMTAA